MAVFNFRLAQVLRLQQAVEDMEKRKLQQRLGELAQAEEALAQAREQRIRFLGRMQQAEAGGLPAAQLITWRNWHPVLAQREEERQQERVTAEEAVDEQRQHVYRARLERRTLEQLEERQKEQFMLAQAQLEQVALDELAVQSWPNGERL
ncbi:MAG: hypothetical protein GX033_04650 [Firmicutes bacterium]|nr:hypothetical protein [Bacillota bacterium]